ncbi:GDP-L-fucose synthase [Antarcticibacterium flavum]|uniref:GDP-L-fucose synthase n=1 Tax=Antarcticibacterium flavum TaxID=2058175 RepID=A0A5B7X3M1_9FLAO|nr:MULTISPECIES: GDP-L-fucose synthase [Antarcticibacterium]MCM4160979.1 GDP-fucose synthetase [Antarcticibacterium sp. W02-3]QCY69291.1 GDP-L-fucose synthase [Antarcticibacterium flavum]
MEKHSRIYIAGHKGMVGTAIWKKLQAEGYSNLNGKTSKELDLRNQKDVNNFINSERPDVIIDAAARVGGIMANKEYPYQFLMENLQMQNNLIDAAYRNDVQKFIFLGSSCIYPKHAPQPIKEEYLLTGSLEPTNEFYAIAKIAGVKACEAINREYGRDFHSLMPTNLYGPNDNFDLQTSHVLAAMIRKFHDAKMKSEKTGHREPVELWGTGTPFREFLHVEDLADAVCFAMENNLPENLYNVGSGNELSIKDLAELIQKIVGHQGDIHWDSSKPDGTPRKLTSIDKLKREGWESRISLEEGIRSTYEWFLEQEGGYKEVRINS